MSLINSWSITRVGIYVKHKTETRGCSEAYAAKQFLTDKKLLCTWPVHYYNYYYWPGPLIRAAERKLKASDVQKCCCSASLSLFISMHKMFSVLLLIFIVSDTTVHEEWLKWTFCTLYSYIQWIIYACVCWHHIDTFYFYRATCLAMFTIMWSIVAVLYCEWESRYM